MQHPTSSGYNKRFSVSCLLKEWTITGESALEKLLNQLHHELSQQQRQALVVLGHRDDRCWLTVGIGGEKSMLGWCTETDTDPWDGWYVDDLVSNNGTSGKDEVGFESADQASYFPASVLIPNEEARAAVRTYAATGARPSQISWRDMQR